MFQRSSNVQVVNLRDVHLSLSVRGRPEFCSFIRHLLGPDSPGTPRTRSRIHTWNSEEEADIWLQSDWTRTFYTSITRSMSDTLENIHKCIPHISISILENVCYFLSQMSDFIILDNLWVFLMKLNGFSPLQMSDFTMSDNILVLTLEIYAGNKDIFYFYFLSTENISVFPCRCVKLT